MSGIGSKLVLLTALWSALVCGGISLATQPGRVLAEHTSVSDEHAGAFAELYTHGRSPKKLWFVVDTDQAAKVEAEYHVDCNRFKRNRFGGSSGKHRETFDQFYSLGSSTTRIPVPLKNAKCDFQAFAGFFEPQQPGRITIQFRAK